MKAAYHRLMAKTLHYLFDPLCGWCYGASPAVSGLLGAPDVTVKLWPTGLFGGDGARTMDDGFAAFAWTNDQRIQQLTGQTFTEAYRQQVLGNRQQRFDSGPATLALTAVALTALAREYDALKSIQQARYLDGSDVTSPATLAGLLVSLGLEQAASRMSMPDAALVAANAKRIQEAQSLMRSLNARGVPTLVAESGARRWVVNISAAYSNPQALLDELEAA